MTATADRLVPDPLEVQHLGERNGDESVLRHGATTLAVVNDGLPNRRRLSIGVRAWASSDTRANCLRH